ncbi:hypothetical protein IFR05_002253 [Cadophora sp. M221]|nr:hypothetical protein IFR05_002253 [Cadophora sp. M221]
MQFTAVASLGLFAAVASASQHVPQHFHQRRQYNASVPSTTLTVYATEVYTITSCAATVTDCPADQSTSEQVITSTVAAYTTVCPVAEASSASKAVLSSYSALASSTAKGPVTTPKGTGYPTKPYPTGETETTPSAPIGTGFTTKGEVVYPTASGSESVVLTYTLGSGTSTTVVTTTIKHTQTATVYATKPGSPEESGSLTAGVPTSTDELTTTITGTSTSTRYITVLPAASGTQGIAGSAECVPVTVTVTQATATVTVTAPAYPTSTGKNSGDVTSAPGAASYPTESANSEIVSLSTATVIPVPYSTGAPYGNATMSTSTKKKCSSVYPSGYVSTGVPSGAAVPTGSYPVSSSKPSGVASPSAGYPVKPVESATPSSSKTAEGPATTPAGYPVESAAPSTTSSAEGVVTTSAPAAGYPVNAYPTY